MCMDKSKPMLAWVSAVHNHAYHISTTGYMLHDTHVILVLMQGLPESYSHLAIALNATPAEKLTLNYTIDRLLSEEAWQETPYVTQREINSALSATQNKGKLGQNVTCFTCSEKGHYAAGYLQGRLLVDLIWRNMPPVLLSLMALKSPSNFHLDNASAEGK